MSWRLLILGCAACHLMGAMIDARAGEAATVTLSLHQAPLEQVIRQWAEQTQLNVIVPEPIEQTLSARLESVPKREALDILAMLAGLEAREHRGVWVVASSDYFETLDARQALIKQEIRLLHRDALDVLPLLEPSLSARGQLLLDEQGNRLWATDTQANIEMIEAIAASIDEPIAQVLIESRIVIANRDFNRALGLAFGINKQQPDDASGVLTSASSEAAISGATGQINLSLLSARYRLDAELSALEASGRGRVISTPRVMVANRAEAFIQQGVSVPFEAVQSGEGSSTGAVSVQFKEAVLALKATPLVLADGRIQLDLHITQDTVGQIFQTGRGGSVPSIDTRQLGTRVWVEDGQTLVLGGIFQEQDATLMAGVPGLSKLPGVGRLFQRNSHDDQRRELLVFITPSIQP